MTKTKVRFGVAEYIYKRKKIQKNIRLLTKEARIYVVGSKRKN